jgi:mycothiol synthase
MGAMSPEGPPAGYRSRPASEVDADSIYRVIHDYDVSMVGYSDFARDDLFELFREEHFDIQRDTRVVLDREGRVVGFATLWGREPGRRYIGFAVVAREHTGRGIGTHLLGFLERRMAEHVADEDGAILHNFIDRADVAARRLVEAVGFSEVRRHYTMAIDLGERDTEPSVPAGISIRTCHEDDAELIHALTEETFAEHWGHTPLSFERWRKQYYERSDTDLSMWFLASEGDEPAGFLVGRAMDGLGWVGDLGVRKPHRRRGIASALLRHSFADFQRRGLSKVGLGVDASNETNAVRVYEKVGMRSERVYATYEKLYR